MNGNLLRRLEAYGQSIWLDFIRRGMLVTDELQRLSEKDGVSGVTSNPAIFEKAIAETGDYDDAIRILALAGKSAGEIYEELAVEDIRLAADQLRPIHDRTGGRAG